MARKKIAVFCSASNNVSIGDADRAYKLCSILGQDYDLIYGLGTMGLMGIVANAFMDAGAMCYGYGLKDFEREGVPDSDKNLVACWFDDIAERTHEMIMDCDAVLVLTGGMGTMLELSMAYVMRQSKLEGKESLHIFIDNIRGYYDNIQDFLRWGYKRGTTSKPHKYIHWLDGITQKQREPEHAYEVIKSFLKE